MSDPTYQLRITKLVPNPAYNQSGHPGYCNDRCEPLKEVESLTTEITEAQFQAIRKAALEQFGVERVPSRGGEY